MKNIKRDSRFKLILNDYNKDEQLNKTIRELKLLVSSLENVRKSNANKDKSFFSLLDLYVTDMRNEMARTYIMLAKLEKMFMIKQMNKAINKMMEREVIHHKNKRNLF